MRVGLVEPLKPKPFLGLNTVKTCILKTCWQVLGLKKHYSMRHCLFLGVKMLRLL